MQDNEVIEIITVKPEDVLGIRYVYNENYKYGFKIELYPRIPKKSLSNDKKGDLGEFLVKTHLNLCCDKDESLYYITPRRTTFDVTSTNVDSKRYEVKSGFERHDGNTGTATEFNHYLDTNHPGANAIKISDSKYKKNYVTQGIDLVVLVDFFDDPYRLPNFYVMPADCDEVKNLTKIVIPTSGKGKYAKYQIDVSDVFMTRERPSE